MKLKLLPTILSVGLFITGLSVLSASEETDLVGSWKLDIANSSPISPWDKQLLEITITDGIVRFDREMHWSRHRSVSDVTRVKPDGVTVTTNPVTHWLDTWYNNVYIGTDHQKQVRGDWLEGGQALQLVTNLNLEAQQGDVPVQIDDLYRLSADGNTLTLTQQRSTRDQQLNYVYQRVLKFAEPEGTITTASGLKYAITHQGAGAQPNAGQVVIAHYTGTLVDGTIFDSSIPRNEPFAFTLDRKQVIKGWDEGFALLRVGDQATLIIPPELAYGARDREPIPPNSTLKFEVELVDIKEHALADNLKEVIDEHGLEAGLLRFVELKTSGFSGYFVSEGQLNGLGYGYLMTEKLPEALAIFKLNVELHPTSGNTHDSLGEALLANGQKEEALAEYRQSLALDPTNENAVKVIADLTEPE